MEPLTLEEDIQDAFEQLDHLKLRAYADQVDSPPDDAARVALAFGLLAAEERERADALLAAVEGDGTCPMGDFAYVRAFRCELDGDWEGVAATLLHHLDRKDSTHAGRMRLRVADALLSLKRLEEIPPVLDPLIQPPGVPETLEAYLILISAELAGRAGKEKLVEYAAIVDGLLERGHHLDTVINTVYYANLLDASRMDGLVEPLLRSHEDLLDTYADGDREDVLFLLAAGEKYKIPAAVRAAGLSYAQAPFPFTEDPEPGKAAYLFASHEEHEAARLVFIYSFPKSRIRKQFHLWGPLLISSYHAEKFKEALALLKEHHQELPGLPIATHAGIIRIVCEYYLGRLDEAWQHFERMGLEAFMEDADFLEAAVLVYLCWAAGREQDAVALGREIVKLKGDDREFVGEFLPRCLSELLIRDRSDLVKSWMELFLECSPPGTEVSNLVTNGLAAFEWAMPEAVRAIAELLGQQGATGLGDMLAGLLAAEQGDEALAETLLERAVQETEGNQRVDILLQRAVARRRHHRFEKALQDIDTILEKHPEYPRRHMPLAMKAGTLRHLKGVPRTETDPLLEEAKGHVRRHARDNDQRAIGEVEISHYFHGTSPDVLLRNLSTVMGTHFARSTESWRLARRILMAYDHNAGEREAALRYREEWIGKNLQPEWPEP